MRQMIKISLFLLSGLALSNCTPKVELAAPTEPVTINLNVKVDKDLDEVFTEESGLF